MLKGIIQVAKCSAVVAALLSSPALYAESAVWKVSKGDAHLYLGGTVHLLPPSQFPLPKEFEQAYKAAQVLVFEVIDMNPNDPAMQQQMMAKMMYSDGSTLQSKLSPKTYKALAEACKRYGLDISFFNGFKPSMAVVSLVALEFARLGMAGEGVDKYYENKAKKDNKNRLGLETLDYQLTAIAAMGEGSEDAFVEKSLADLEDTQAMMDKTLSAWRKGDMKTIDTIMVQAIKGYSDTLYENLLVKRNNNWLPKIEQMLTTQPVEFVLVGTAHLAGKDSVIAGLKSKGYKIEKL